VRRARRVTRRGSRSSAENASGVHVGTRPNTGHVIVAADDHALALDPSEADDLAAVIDRAAERVAPCGIVCVDTVAGSLVAIAPDARNIARDLRANAARVRAGLS
jgi:hypothetical protein